jgi:hypothetical protein
MEQKNKDKLLYKLAIKREKDAAKNVVSDSLQEELASKNNVAFWKTWKNKVSNKPFTKIHLQDNPSPKLAAERFAEYFEGVCSPNSSDFNITKLDEFKDKVKKYSGSPYNAKYNITVQLIEMSLNKMRIGKSPGFDNITTEHVIHSHPVIFSLLSKLFNSMLISSYVPQDFGKGITIPIPKNEKVQGPQSIDTFRGISLSPMLSKLFEHCLLMQFSKFFITSYNQLGFKPKSGCQHAIYTVRKVVEYYINNNSSVNLCCLDISKGFDKVNHSVLFLKLMKRGAPSVLINLLYYWYSISYNCVRWENVLSRPYRLLAGIRQGGVLSPVLFSVYVNDLLDKFAKFGCYFKGIPISAIMYADDLVLLSPSTCELQNMLNICSSELTLLDLQVNVKKCSAIRIGNRYKSKCTDLCLKDNKIPWTTEVKYLGIYIVAAAKFKCSFDAAKIKYYRSANAILAKLGNSNNKPVILKLIWTMALPCLTYALEALSLNKTELTTINSPWSRSFEKIFNTFDKNLIKQCQLYTGYKPMLHMYALKVMSFLEKANTTDNIMLKTLSTNLSTDDISRLALLFNTNVLDFKTNYRVIIDSNFEQL